MVLYVWVTKRYTTCSKTYSWKRKLGSRANTFTMPTLMVFSYSGLKVVMPSNPYDAKGLLLSSIFDNNPVIFIEHRWLHNMEGEYPSNDYRIPLGKANIVQEGNDITLVSNSYMTVEAIHASNHLKNQNINSEVIDLRTIRPIDWDTIYNSVRKTGHLIVLDTGSHNVSIASEIISRVTEKMLG